MASQEDLEKIRVKVRVLEDSKATNEEKEAAANTLEVLARGNPKAVAAQGALPPLVQMLRDGDYMAKCWAAQALSCLAFDEEVAVAIAACGGREALRSFMADPDVYMRNEDFGYSFARHTLERLENVAKKLQAAVDALESETSTSDEQCQAAEQLGTWAAASDEMRGAINRAGGAEALVALVVSGSDEAKLRAATALAILSYNQDAKAAILKADGIAMLTPLAKHGKGPVKKAASEALQLLSQKLDPMCPSVSGYPNAAATGIPTGEGTRVAMFSARFDGGPMEKKFRNVYSILRDHKYDILMVAADAGESFADLTTEYLGRLQEEQGTMLAVSTKHYGEMTASAYSSHKELKFALDYENDVKFLPLKVEDTYPPQPAGGPEHKYDKKGLAKKYILSVFKPGLVYLDCRNRSEREIAADIAEKLQKNRKT